MPYNGFKDFSQTQKLGIFFNMVCSYTWGRLLVLVVSLVFSKGSDPCTSYTELDNPYRSTGYVAKEGVDPMICDLNLKTGWYRFVNKVGGEMPNTKIDRLHCGTHAPIWMRGQHPSAEDGIVVRTACVNFNGILNGCIPIPIKVKKCTGPFYVYRLRAPFGCQMAYCAGTKQPCPRGQSGIHPNCKVLRKKDFPFDDVPIPKVTYVDDAQREVTLKCDFDVPPGGDVSFEIQWFVNGKGLGHVACDDPDKSTCGQLGSKDYELGDQIRCDIRARYNTHPENEWTQAKASHLFFAGIEIEPTHLDCRECDASPANKIKLRPTLPVRGEDITLRFGTWDDPGAFLANTCELTFKTEEESKWTDVSIQAVCDNNNQLFSPTAFTFTVSSTHSFWGGYAPPPVTVAKIENPVGICLASGDPHYTTFDGMYYDFYRPGDFVMYRNKERHFEIHTRLWHCGSTVTCNCGVAIREKQNVIVLTSCTQDLISKHGMPMKVLITSNRRLTRGTKIFVRNPGDYSEYEVRLPSGTVVKISHYSWGNNVIMEAPRSDKTKTEGMCGNYDGDKDNDLKNGEKTYTDPDAFGESWRVDKSKSLFHTVPPCVDETCDDTELGMDRCRCAKTDGLMTVTCELDLMQFNGIGDSGFKDKTEDFQKSNREKRDLVYSDDIIYLYDDYEPEENIYLMRKKRALDTKMSLENATDYCEKTILNTAAAKVCLEVSGVDASNAIQSCAADLKLTGDLNWVKSAFENLKESCEFQAVKDFSAYDKDEEGKFVPPVKIARNLCPNDCSSNGKCINGSCVCNEGFVAADCSMRIDQIPRLFRVLDNGLCDIRARPCMKTIIFGEYFLDSENLTCHVREFLVSPGKWIPSSKTKTLRGSKTDLFAVECHIPKPPINLGNFDEEGSPAAGYIISVSNDKVHESVKTLKLITFDSVCQDCDIARGCSLKNGSCLIKSHCFAEGNPSPKDWCQQCNSSVSQTRWTRRTINFPPKITTPSERYALVKEDLQLQLKGEDPEGRPFTISLLNGSPPEAKLTNRGVLLWKPESTVKETFYFKVTDECNASSTFEMTIEILACPCTDKGTCKPDPNHPRGSGMYYCECQHGYKGQKCEKEIDECLSSPCAHGSCIDQVNNYVCNCNAGFTGRYCDVPIMQCDIDSCYPGVPCTENSNSAVTCGSCPSGLTGDGKHCKGIDECVKHLCANGGTCLDGVNSYSCSCLTGYTGDYCETDIDDCVNHACSNGGWCIDGVNSYSCNCMEGFTGKFCDIDIDDCVNHTCENGGTCVDAVNGYSCNCPLEFTGDRCESATCKSPEITTKHAQATQRKGTRYRTGQIILLSCKVGYKGIGNEKLKCKEGKWIATNFYCEKTCLPPWTELKKRCYMVVEVKSPRWKDASAKCQRERSHMVTISSEEENDFAAQLATAYLKNKKITQVQMWLGLVKRNSAAEFQWVDGTSPESFTNWSPGEPNNSNGKELCTEMLVTGRYTLKKWNDVRCDTTSYKAITICERLIRDGE